MKAVLVFCEGRHDVVFAQRSLGAHGDCAWVEGPVRALPSPFGRGPATAKGLIAARLERDALEDRTLRAAAHPPLPCFESVVQNAATDTIFFLVRAHGKEQSAPVLDLLRDLDVTIIDEPAGTFAVSRYAAAFLLDADGDSGDANGDRDGVASTVAGLRNRYGAHFGDLANLDHGRWVAGTTVPVGCFVFHRSPQDRAGTIEDHLAPMVERAWPPRYAGARRFIDDNRAQADEVSGSEAERLKAIITVSGQFNHPGDPLSNIIGRGGLPPKAFQESPTSAELADFLTRTPWDHA